MITRLTFLITLVTPSRFHVKLIHLKKRHHGNIETKNPIILTPLFETLVAIK